MDTSLLPAPPPRLPALDRVGIFASLVCLVHCAAVPVLALVIPMLGSAWVVGEWLGWTGIALASSVAAVTLRAGHERHGRLGPLALAAGGILLLLVGELTVQSSLVAGASMSLVGALGVIAAHVSNRRLCHSCRVCGNDRCAAPVLDHHRHSDPGA